MSFFQADHLQALAEAKGQTTSTEMRALIARMQALHEGLDEHIQLYDLGFHLFRVQEQIVHQQSVTLTGNDEQPLLCVLYLRSKAQAVVVERLMGREEVASMRTIEAQRHPTLELRLTPSKLSLEIILSPDAWWDQQNLTGKLSIARHKQDFYMHLRELTSRYCMGFWGGAHLSEMHLAAHQFQHPRIMDEWMSTFEPGTDYWRIGVWYDLDEPQLDEEAIIPELVRQLRLLHQVYTHIIWESDNNFREFYRGMR